MTSSWPPHTTILSIRSTVTQQPRSNTLHTDLALFTVQSMSTVRRNKNTRHCEVKWVCGYRITSSYSMNRVLDLHRIPSKYSTPIILAPRNILSLAQILYLSRLKPYSLINKTLNMSLINIECYFILVLTLI